MARSAHTIDAYLEIGKKRTFAGALDWPGWCRSGRDEGAALQALIDTGPRYARVLQTTRLDFQAPPDPSALRIVERLKGSATTDFGAPDTTPTRDRLPVDEAELRRLQALLQACWQALDMAVEAATGKELRKGPRGGGRDLDGIVRHVLGSTISDLARLAWKYGQREADSLRAELGRIRQATLDALTASVRGELPTRGPRGGVIWTARPFVRRVTWHVLDHVWEIEDRSCAEQSQE